MFCLATSVLGHIGLRISERSSSQSDLHSIPAYLSMRGKHSVGPWRGHFLDNAMGPG